MTERPKRLVMFLMAVACAFLWFVKGRDYPVPTDNAAFFCALPGSTCVMVKGDLPNPGVFVFPDSVTVASVIKMTAPVVLQDIKDNKVLSGQPPHGGELTVIRRGDKLIEFRMKTMSVWQRITLGIPLDPNSMDTADWEELPGIGSTRAEAIVRDRQINGDFRSPEEIKRVPGIGEHTYQRLTQFFFAAITN